MWSSHSLSLVVCCVSVKLEEKKSAAIVLLLLHFFIINLRWLAIVSTLTLVPLFWVSCFSFIFFFSHNEVLHFSTIYTMPYLHWNGFPYSVVHFALPHAVFFGFSSIGVCIFQVRCHFLIKIITQFRQLMLDYMLSQLILMKSNEEIGSYKNERDFRCYQLTKTVLFAIYTFFLRIRKFNDDTLPARVREALQKWMLFKEDASLKWCVVSALARCESSDSIST